MANIYSGSNIATGGIILAQKKTQKKCKNILWRIDLCRKSVYDAFMADVIEFVVPEKIEKPVAPPAPRTYSVDIVQYPDNLAFTVNGIKVSPDSLYKIASELEKIAQIIRTDIVTGIVPGSH